MLKVLTENYFLIYKSYKINIYKGTDDFQHYFEIPLICVNINEAICQIRHFWSFVFILCFLLKEMRAVNFVSPGPWSMGGSWGPQPLGHSAPRPSTAPDPHKEDSVLRVGRSPGLQALRLLELDSTKIKQGYARLCPNAGCVQEEMHNRNYDKASTTSKMRISPKKC